MKARLRLSDADTLLIDAVRSRSGIGRRAKSADVIRHALAAYLSSETQSGLRDALDGSIGSEIDAEPYAKSGQPTVLLDQNSEQFQQLLEMVALTAKVTGPHRVVRV